LDLFALLDTAKRKLDAEFSPHGYNIGINDGPAAGQTVVRMQPCNPFPGSQAIRDYCGRLPQLLQTNP
jgi:hypothetical protein